MTSGQETERVHSYNPGARTGWQRMCITALKGITKKKSTKCTSGLKRLQIERAQCNGGGSQQDWGSWKQMEYYETRLCVAGQKDWERHRQKRWWSEELQKLLNRRQDVTHDINQRQHKTRITTGNRKKFKGKRCTSTGKEMHTACQWAEKYWRKEECLQGCETNC